MCRISARCGYAALPDRRDPPSAPVAHRCPFRGKHDPRFHRWSPLAPDVPGATRRPRKRRISGHPSCHRVRGPVQLTVRPLAVTALSSRGDVRAPGLLPVRVSASLQHNKNGKKTTLLNKNIKNKQTTEELEYLKERDVRDRPANQRATISSDLRASTAIPPPRTSVDRTETRVDPRG